ncbi:hypothetical protein GCM10023096_22400 [Nonomuraea ferruginea]
MASRTRFFWPGTDVRMPSSVVTDSDPKIEKRDATMTITFVRVPENSRGTR